MDQPGGLEASAGRGLHQLLLPIPPWGVLNGRGSWPVVTFQHLCAVSMALSHSSVALGKSVSSSPRKQGDSYLRLSKVHTFRVCYGVLCIVV